MIRITKEEVQKLASISKLKVAESEISGFIQDLESVLSYAAKVVEIAGEVNVCGVVKNVNIMREDLVVPTNPRPILAQAPISEDDYFVVPKIIEND